MEDDEGYETVSEEDISDDDDNDTKMKEWMISWYWFVLILIKKK